MKGFRTLLPYIIGISLFLITGWAYAATFIVDNLGDVDDGKLYTEGDGTNTLRKCIRLANQTPGADTINFSVSGTISPASALPAITDDGTVIDASSQWIGAWPEGQPGITLDGSNAGIDVYGLSIDGADNCHIRGLFLTNFGESGVSISEGAQFNTVGGAGVGYRNVISGNQTGVSIEHTGTKSNKICGNYIGTDVNGIANLGNSNHGIYIAAGAQSNTIGGTTEGERNIISGNGNNGVIIADPGTNNNVVSGNYIGTDVNGTVALGNSGAGVAFHRRAQFNIIGGTTSDERNIISGNGAGVGFWNSGTNSNIVSGNYIGTDMSGTADLGNSSHGIYIGDGAQSNIIGGIASGEGNIIAFNGGNGISVDGTDTDYNKMSSNSMHDNGGLGIGLVNGGNDEIPAPTITSNNLVGNTLVVSGNGAGANATVEIFKADSFESGEGKTYLGSLVAHGDGGFSSSIGVTGKGLSIGDSLVATTTHTNNNTSEFSAPQPIQGETPTPHALSLDGYGDYVDVGTNPSLNFSNQLTIEAWVRFDVQEMDLSVFGSSNPSVWGQRRLSFRSNALTLAQDETNCIELAEQGPIPAGKWIHYAGTYDGSTVKVYWDGVLKNYKDWSGSLPPASDNLIGSFSPAGWYMIGLIDEVRIWNYALTQEEIQATMNTTLKGDEPGLVGYWNFDDSTAKDSSPYGNHGTLMGDAEIIPLVGTWPPKKIGDVSGNGTISAYDAALILQYVVGLISEFPADSMGSPSVISPRSYIVKIPELSARAGDRIHVPVAINDATGLLAGGISLKYDRTVLRAIKALPDMALNGSYWKANTELEGEIRFAFATTEPTKGQGNILLVEFEALPNAEGKTSRLIIDNVNLSNSLNIAKVNGSVTVIPSTFALLQNYPNPFNPDTWIPFELATDASVTINIYNQKGQLIRTIVLGQKSAGVYLSKDRAVYWDGRDDFGEKVSSGVYFYNLQAGKFIATRKLVVVK